MPDKGHLFPMDMSSTFAWVSGAGMQAAGCGRPKAALQEAAAGTVLSLKATEGREQPAPALCEARSPLSHRGPPKHILGEGSLLGAVVLKQIKTEPEEDCYSFTPQGVRLFFHLPITSKRKTAHDPTSLWFFEIGGGLRGVGWNHGFSTNLECN